MTGTEKALSNEATVQKTDGATTEDCKLEVDVRKKGSENQTGNVDLAVTTDHPNQPKAVADPPQELSVPPHIAHRLRAIEVVRKGFENKPHLSTHYPLELVGFAEAMSGEMYVTFSTKEFRQETYENDHWGYCSYSRWIGAGKVTAEGELVYLKKGRDRFHEEHDHVGELKESNVKLPKPYLNSPPIKELDSYDRAVAVAKAAVMAKVNKSEDELPLMNLVRGRVTRCKVPTEDNPHSAYGFILKEECARNTAFKDRPSCGGSFPGRSSTQRCFDVEVVDGKVVTIRPYTSESRGPSQWP
ncbi:MAG: hypothetical protein A2289_21705 [Deltaproteobacteria bacterium RIFOXYA12_FULL_58_15]|nr:MAG: hypothetical protein A2289_21705 [Deltaproteobacteria bacterium RIFOXYA12_FULL_58_15]OGR09529.1 MAG: hypothetical protein A2341_16580 [Deltaproteobacteria bacterium RIFOXYB12_FULL_58_9]